LGTDVFIEAFGVCVLAEYPEAEAAGVVVLRSECGVWEEATTEALAAAFAGDVQAVDEYSRG
jgi:hypothetical protein